jgi:hypothetical protein
VVEQAMDPTSEESAHDTPLTTYDRLLHALTR